MTRYSRDDLWKFVWRADTPKKIAIAKDWLDNHVDDLELWNDLCTQLAHQSVNYYRAQSGRELL